MPTIGQLILLGLSVAFFAAGGGISIARLRGEREGLRIAAKGCMYLGVTAAAGVLIWHSAMRGAWMPMNDNFDALTWLALLLALFVMYMQRVKPVTGLDWFVMPIVILLLTAAGIFGRLDYRAYHGLVGGAWLWVHRVTAYGGAAAFAVAAAGGLMYIVASRRLRRKRALPVLGSLERLERMTMHAVTLGFALLTVGLVTGFVRMAAHDDRPPTAKLLLGSLSWVVYAIALHLPPINPRFRGRRAAMLSVFGFVLLIGTIIVVQLMPGGRR